MRGYGAVVTGGAQGIGKGIAQALSRAGMQVVILDVDRRAGRQAAAEIENSMFVEGDAADEADVREAVRQANRKGLGLYAAVANAGIFKHGPLEGFTLADWNRMLGVHLTGAFLLAKIAAPALALQRGALVMVSSIRAWQAEPGWEAYCAAKGGLLGLSKALALSLGPKVRVNCVSPGWVPTDEWQRSDKAKQPKLSKEDQAQQAIGRVGSPADIAELVRFLVSPEAAFITGANVVIDGGLSCRLPV